MSASTFDYLLIGISLCLTTAGQILQKIAADKALARDGAASFLLRILSCRETYWAIGSLVLGTIVWIAVLYRMQVGKAVPFLSLGFVLVVVVSRFKFDEHIRLQRWLGVAVISLGLMLISQS